MILVGTRVVAGLQNLFIGQILQVGPYLPLHEPGKGVEPADDARQLSYQHVDGMPLAGMSTLMSQYLVQFFGSMRTGTDKYPVEERERAFRSRKQVYGSPVYFLRRATTCQADDACQLDQTTHGQQDCHSPVGHADTVGHQQLPVGFRLHRGSDFRQDHGCIEVGHGHHRFLPLDPGLDVEQRYHSRHGKEAQQGRPPPDEERILVEKQPVESIEQGNRYIDFQKIDHRISGKWLMNNG